MYKFNFSHSDNVPLYKQLANSVINDITKGVVKKGFQLPSINEVNKYYSLARDTVERAYKELKKQGYVTSTIGRGYFITNKKEHRIKVLLVFNKLSSFKRIIYDSFLASIGPNAKVDLQIHHYNLNLLEEILDNCLGQYHYYVIMPHFLNSAKRSEVIATLSRVPPEELFLLDKNIMGLGNTHMSVYQNFKNDLYTALSSVNDLLNKYNNLKISLEPLSNHPLEILEGAKQYCTENKKGFDIVTDMTHEVLQPDTVYVVTGETDLAMMLKKVRKSDLLLAKDVGIISFNETPFKELLNITVITTDFEAMGAIAAKMILDRDYKQIQNSFKIIRRTSA